MKKLIFAVSAICALGLTSCGFGTTSSANYSATVAPVETSITSNSLADLQVGDRVTYRYSVPKDDRISGQDYNKIAAVYHLLKANGNAEVLISPEYKYEYEKGKLMYVEVSGRPAKYKNFRSAE